MGGAKFCRFALFPLMLFMLLLLPANMVAQTDYDESVTLTELDGNPEGYRDETYANLFDCKKENGNFSKWCCKFNGSAYVIFKASKAGIPVGYTITTGNDNASEHGRNPLSWKLYGNNEGKDGAWTLIDKVENDKVLQDKNYTSYNFKCEGSTSYQYFKWEISAIHSGNTLQVGEFELKLQTCSHKKANGSSALGEVINTVETTCAEQGYTTHECSLCNSIVKVYLNDKLKPHTLTHHALKAATCTEAGIIEYWQCSVCNKLFSNEAATTEIADATSLEIPAKGHQYNSEGICTVCSHETVKFTELAGDPVGNSGETYANLFDGKKEDGNFSKWCGKFDSPKGAYVIFEANKAGIPVGYTITTGDDNANWGCSGRNPLSWKLYGNNEGKDGAWTLIDKVENDKVLQDKNYTSYDFTCEGSTSYKYFKWEISAIHSGSTLQVGEFELKLKTCSHKDAGGSSALGEIINTVETTCAEHGYTTHKCSICNSIVKVYKDDVLKPHTLTHHELKPATCTETGIREYWQCSVCNKLFSDADATTEITDATSLEIPANGHKFDSEGNCTGCQYKDSRYALFNNLDGITDVVITDNGSYPWQMLDLNADGMSNVSFYFTADSKGLMSSNYKVNDSFSETVIRFNVSKPLLLTSQVLVSSQKTWDKFDIYVDNKLDLRISGEKQTECKVLLSVGEHSLKLSYQKDNGIYKNADRAFLYNLKTSTTIDDYVADYESSNNTLTFKRITSDNLEDLDLSRSVMICNAQTISDMCSLLGIETWTIKNIVFKENFKTYAPTSLNSFFKYLNELQTITNLKYLNTANVTDMSDMFYKCYKLSSLDLSNFNTANVTNMYEMFCDCNNLSSLDLSNFNTAKVTNMGNMFENCNKLTSLDLTSFNTAKVEYMWKMFYNCSALTTIYASDKFVTDKVADGRLMFSGCTNLKGYDSSKTDYKYANYGTDGYFSRPAYAEFDKSTGTLTFKCSTSKPAGVYDLNEGRILPDWNNLRTNVKKVVFDASFASARPTNCYGWFKDFTNLTTIEGFEYLNTENVTNMTGVFNGCSALTSLDLTNFNTAKVTDMKLLFANCSALESLDLSMFNTENVTSMPNMFNGATNLKTLNVSNFNTEKVNNMGHMFAYCPNLTSLDLSSFNTKGVEYVDNIFKNCSNLTTIYASENFAFGSGLKNGADMFLGCDKLKGFIEYNKNTDKNNSEFANYKTGYFTKLVGKNGEEKIGAVGETLTAESLALDDDKDFVAYEPFAATTASYSREMKTGTTWATLCLPFEVSLDGQNFRAFKLLSADDATETVELEEIETSIAAGTPVIIKMKDGETQLDFSVENKAIAKDVQTAETANGNYQLQGLYTQKVFDKDADNNCYIVKGDKLMNPAKLLANTNVKKVASKPFRAYMVDNSSSAAAGAKMFSIGFDDSITTIDTINTIANDKAEYYDLQGKRLNEPQKGINIVKRGGKTMKVIIK